ncbi:response regulator [Zhihengliuella sp.]|uniref:response regulator n=1 Tax=Zhihengliuella sp. TaxID=1954483 RepID=UPI002811969C|nr:response regulator [Zhihengliuella sp.]
MISFAATAFAIGLAAAIYRRQAEEAVSDRERHSALLVEIKGTSSAAAESARSAHTNTDEILRYLNEAQRNRTGHDMNPSRASEVTESLSSMVADKVAPVLWVDDDPASIVLERAALRAAGIATVWVDSTSRALDLLDGNEFGAVITDMGRREGPREGYVLLEAMQDQRHRTPVIVYSGSDRPEHEQEALSRGCAGATSDPTRLFQLVRRELQRDRG